MAYQSYNKQPPAVLTPLAVGIDGLRALLGDCSISDVTAWRWEKRGLIDRVPGVSHRLWTVTSIKRMVAGKTKVA